MEVEERILTAWRTWTTRRVHRTTPADERAAETPRPAPRPAVTGGDQADATAHIALTIDDR